MIEKISITDVSWHGTTLNSRGFGDPEARALALTIAGIHHSSDLHVMINMFWEPLVFDVPAGTWHVAVDTFAASPADTCGGKGPAVAGHCTVHPRSIVVLANA